MEIEYCGQRCYLGRDLLYRCNNVAGLTVGVEICEDIWVAAPPSIKLAQNGATVLLNASCSNEVVGKSEYREKMVCAHSGHMVAAYIYTSSGWGESTTDLIVPGHNVIANNGYTLAESEFFTTGIISAEIDLDRIARERTFTNTWVNKRDKDTVTIPFDFDEKTIAAFEPQTVHHTHPFVPKDKVELKARSKKILSMQAAGLATRLKHIGADKVILGLSGGLDSTLALIVCAEAFDMLGLARSGIKAVSMPCFGTTERTKNNALNLAKGIDAEYIEIPIEASVRQHFADIGQDESNHDITYENAQARERTQVLMDLSNKLGGIVVGTGDLSELALGWATYNGDHMSMYAVNSSIPKTLVRHLVAYYADVCDDKDMKEALLDVLDTPVSPELLPPENGEISQKTEDIVGPYELHDYFLYYMVRCGFAPAKIFRLAVKSFDGIYDSEIIKGWMKVFYRRFFSQQFKRSCMPDGPKVGTVTLSPRGDFRMPSDACARIWLDEIEKL